MAETHNPHSTNGRGFEEQDANVGALAKFGLGLAIVTVVVFVLMVWLQSFFAVQTKRAMPASSPLVTQRQAPAAPRLQIAPEKDLQNVRLAEDSVLHSYGWIVRDSGVVRLPITRAMELTAQRGLPFRESKMDKRESRIEAGGPKP